VRAGLRLQILVLLGALLLFAFIPLYLAVATYTTVALQQIRVSHARVLGRAVAAHVIEALPRRSASELQPLLRAQIGEEGVDGIAVFAEDGELLARAGQLPPAAKELLRTTREREATMELGSGRSRALFVLLPARELRVVAVLRLDDQSARAAPLLRLVALYTAVVGVALLVVAYFALTRLIVRPLDALSRAAERVASGYRRLTVPRSSVRELAELGNSLHAMTERLLSEEEALRNKIDEVEAATRRLTDAQDNLIRSERLASVGRLAAGLAHEIGNPLAALIGLQDLLIAGGLEVHEQRDFLARMRSETERIHRILRDLLAFARPPAKSSAEPGDIARAIHDTATLIAPQRAMHDVRLLLDVPETLPRVTLGNEQLMQVLLNLVLNAADAVGTHGEISVSASAHTDTVELRVTDNGPGVSEAMQQRLFEPFATTKDPGKGTGLGLAVCRGLVEAAGGSIRLDTAHAPGARFVVSLPLAKA